MSTHEAGSERLRIEVDKLFNEIRDALGGPGSLNAQVRAVIYRHLSLRTADTVQGVKVKPLSTADIDHVMMEESELYVNGRFPQMILQDVGKNSRAFYDAAQMRAAFRTGYDYANRLSALSPEQSELVSNQTALGDTQVILPSTDETQSELEKLREAARRMLGILVGDAYPGVLLIPEDVDADEFANVYAELEAALSTEPSK